jgi:hypothetical protein
MPGQQETDAPKCSETPWLQKSDQSELANSRLNWISLGNTRSVAEFEYPLVGRGCLRRRNARTTCTMHWHLI